MNSGALKYLEDKFDYFLFNTAAQSELALCETIFVEINW